MTFNLPIFYSENKQELKQHVVNDLELIQTIEPEPLEKSMYDYFIEKSDCKFYRKLFPKLAHHYTTNVSFLKNTQKLLKTFKFDDIDIDNESCNILDLWSEIKKDTGFKEKYMYVNWEIWEFLNHSEQFLQIMSIYNLASPVISLIMPIIILIIPFFVIQFKGLKLTFSEYYQIIKIILSNHSIGKLLTNFNEVKIEQKLYILLSVAFYFFSIYQYILSLLNFKKNMVKIHDYIFNLRKYLTRTISSMDNYLHYSEKLTTYSQFNYIVKEKREILSNLYEQLHKITIPCFSVSKCMEVGYILKTFYKLYNDKSYDDAITYSFEFNGYISILKGIQHRLAEKKLGFAQFTQKRRKNCIKGNYYAALSNLSPPPIKNDISLHNNIIITGPNASGKTTVLKSVLINIILSQQFGCGFYNKATISPYSHLHCYLNIPDTSGRDSLFQAESRRCKEILDIIIQNKKTENHICIFDELFSGTNPDEAVGSATAFMEYLIKNNNVKCLLTTHFIQVCKNLEKNSQIDNCYMDTYKEKDIDKNINTYLLKYGISEVKGGLQVLRDLDYPKEIIDGATII